MAKAADELVERHLPNVLEFLRAVSGLVAVGVLVPVILSLPSIGRPEVTPQREPPAPTSQAVSPIQRPITAQTITLYLVKTTAQAEIADWGEQTALKEVLAGGYAIADHSYEILQAGNPEEEYRAGQIIVENLVENPYPDIVRIVDLREVFEE